MAGVRSSGISLAERIEVCLRGTLAEVGAFRGLCPLVCASIAGEIAHSALSFLAVKWTSIHVFSHRGCE